MISIFSKDIESTEDNPNLLENISLNEFIINSHGTTELEKDVLEKLKKLGISGLPSLFVVDEAKGLRYKNSDKGEEQYFWMFQDWDIKDKTFGTISERSPYNVFRRTFRMFRLPWEILMLIIISTSEQISVMSPELVLDPSRRESTSLKFIENFVLVQTYNVNAEEALSIKAGMFPKENIKDWNDFLVSDFRKEEFFKIGRPLIYGTFVNEARDDLINKNYDLDAILDNCREFSFLSKRLFGGKKFVETENITILNSMFNFAFGVNFLLPHVSKEVLVEKYLMTLIKYFDEDGKCFLAGCYLPEGAFNALSSLYFVKNPNSLHTILSTSIKYGLCNVGSLGELLAQYILIRTAFSCIDNSFEKIRKLIFHYVSLREFLTSLAGRGKEAIIQEFFDLNSALEESKISFSYFEPFPTGSMTQPFDLMARCLYKGSALTLNSQFEGIDLMIPLILKDGKISFLGIQVKFVQRTRVATTVNKAIDKMIFKKMFGRKNIEGRPFGLLILALGDYDYLKAYVERRSKNSTAAPSILTIEGDILLKIDSHVSLIWFQKVLPMHITVSIPFYLPLVIV